MTASNSIGLSGSDTSCKASAGKALLKAIGADTGEDSAAAAGGGLTLAATGHTDAAAGAAVGEQQARVRVSSLDA